MTEADADAWVLSTLRADQTSDRVRWPSDFFDEDVAQSIVEARTRLHGRGAIAQAPSGYWYAT